MLYRSEEIPERGGVIPWSRSWAIGSWQSGGKALVTDGGLETDLIFHHGVDLPDFAAFPLVGSDAGLEMLTEYYGGYAAVAREHRVGLLLESPTWRASTDWGARSGYDAAAMDRINTDAIRFLQRLRERYEHGVSPVLVGGVLGPRGDGYSADRPLGEEEAETYHRAQLRSFASAGADLATAYTLTHVSEAVGIVRAARSVGMPIAISFTVETDGRLPSGMTVGEAIDAVDEAAPPDYFLVNCAHPTHIARGIDASGGGSWRSRIVGLRPNASKLSHAELDEAEELDDGDPGELAVACAELRRLLPSIAIVGGCCGTDARHIAAMWSSPDLR